jgi:hypothetical protein
VQLDLESALIIIGMMFVLGVYLTLDASHYPEEAFERVGTQRIRWQVGPPVLAIVTIGLGTLVAAIHWWAGRRQEVSSAASAIRADAAFEEASNSTGTSSPDSSPEPAAEPTQ